MHVGHFWRSLSRANASLNYCKTTGPNKPSKKKMLTVIVLTPTHALTHHFSATRLHLLKVCYYFCLPFEWTPALWTAENIEYTNIPGSILITQSPFIFCLFLIHSNIKTK